MQYNATIWYWAGQPEGQTAPIIYSSAKAAVVAETDADYIAWIASGGGATPWPRDETGAITVAALDEVLTAAGLPATRLAVLTKDGLNAYANAKQWSLATGGHTVTVGGVARRFATDVTSMTMMDGKVTRMSQPNPPASFNWQFPTGFVNIPAADFVVAATACADFVQATFDMLFETVQPGIADGTITTTAQIDDAAWPSA